MSDTPENTPETEAEAPATPAEEAMATAPTEPLPANPPADPDPAPSEKLAAHLQEARDAIKEGRKEEAREGARPEITSFQAVELLKEGRKLENVRVCGLKLKGDIEFPIEMYHVTLVDFHIEKATFHEPVRLRSCVLKDAKIGRRSVFHGDLDLQGCNLKYTAFRDLEVKGSLRLDNVETYPKTMVDRAKLGGIRFWGAELGNWFEMRDVEVMGETDMRSFESIEGVVLNRCTFHGDVLLRGATINKKLDFGESRFEKSLDLSKAKLHDFTYLESIEQGEMQTFAFYNTVSERVLVRPEQLEGRIYSEKADDYERAAHEFGMLKRNFEALHRYDEEDWAFYRFKVNSRRDAANAEGRGSEVLRRLRQFGDWLFLDVGCGYGTDPFRAVRAAGVIILFFAVVYWLGFNSFNYDQAGTFSWFDKLGYSLVTSITIFTSGFGSDPLTQARGWMLFPLMLEALLGTLLFGLFIVAFSRKVIR